ncbi:VOC family protein [Mesorhizobium tianshanense]|uniref:Putative 3-demethylubiquinone-9 3-methyltransferase (Glyoxalase superfamily) n=1 Tax=Mesorhizobium tianshanense TaxID=39844 RepID=A0A562PF18_9HYPH|nr:VOC family protein [Mesorhizobium tianshanense]TWI43055.1 putative 3-demethylubiquinone-9 3-methyltransferase (glyoxalase superfamily) [Mesorhizobium tianshanense]GLS39691.1 VOC family protein [Mesorhizobium tianshanense]
MKSVTPFLMFEGKAEEAMALYCETIPGSSVLDVTRYGPGEDRPEGTVKLARLSIGGGLDVMVYNSPVHHAFTFTPSVSLYVDCSTEAELNGIVTALAKDGAFLMPPDNYGFSRRFAWLNDRFGVSWQINLA